MSNLPAPLCSVTAKVVNYPGAEVNWTRISEYKHSPNQPEGVRDLPGTVVFR